MKRNREVAVKTMGLCVALGLVLAGLLAAALPAAGQTAGRSVHEQAALDQILGSRAVAWKFNHQQFAVRQLDGRNVLSITNAAAGGLTISGTEQFPCDVEYRLVFRMTPPAESPNVNPSVFFQIGLKGAEDTMYWVPGCYVGGDPATHTVTWHVAGTNGWKVYGPYFLKAVTTPSLAWPEALRKSVEYDMAQLPDLSQKWLTLRYVVRKNSIETYLDDRLLDIRTENTLTTAGSVRLNLSPHLALASLRVEPLLPDDPVYRPIRIDGFLNASLINGKPLDRSGLPATNTLSRVGGAPFLFPEPDAKGNDHVSLFNSCAQFGSLEGYFESMGNPAQFGGRWPTALSVNPARIQFRVPNEHYVRLHMIAAAGDEPHSVPIITAQFFKALAGYPESFAARVPLFTATAKDVVKLPARLQGGKAGSLYLVTIELDPGKLSRLGRLSPLEKDKDSSAPAWVWKDDLPILEMELTKEVHQYRAYPDPTCYSYHQGGLPSSVHVYALTLERSPLRMVFEPDKFGHVWTSPAKPSYTATLGNRTAAARTVELTLSTVSHDGSEKTEQKQTVTVAPGDQDTPVKFDIGNLKRFGYHDVALTMKDGPQTWSEKRSLAYLPVDTRERGNWEDGRGPILGYWAWGGGHGTPSRLQELEIMSEAGAETLNGGFETNAPSEVLAFAQAHNFTGLIRFTASHWVTAGFNGKWNPAKPDEMMTILQEGLTKMEISPGPLNKADMFMVFSEPGVGPSTYGNLPEYWGEPEYKLTPDEERVFKEYLDKFLVCARLARKTWPDVRIMLPYGDPLFVIPFLRYSEEVRSLIDGTALDMPAFERMPEQQLHQLVHHRLYELINEYHKYNKKPMLAVIEGTCANTNPGGLTWDEQADFYTRNFLIYFAYGVYRHPSGPTPFDCANYWGEEHYGCCGLFTCLPYAAPKPSYVAYATLSRHLNRANFEKWLPTGSLSTYALQFKHYQTGKLVHVLWTIRGKRPVTLGTGVRSQNTEDRIVMYDEDDNSTVLAEKDGKVTFTIDSSPCYVEGLTADPQVALGEPDHSDAILRSPATAGRSTSAKPAALAVKLGNPGDGSWAIRAERDEIYENNSPLQVARFLGKMSVAPADAPKEQGGPASSRPLESRDYARASKALAVRLEKQDKERKVMPWYTCLAPKKPIKLPGKASHLGLWVNAASDWGRVVYCLRDAKGQRWISVGTKEQWNCDDTHQWSSFCFDGWRYLRFELPSNLPYDNFREMGSTWWAHYGPGGGVVNLPLSLEKIIVERRTHAMYVNDPQPTRPDDVLLGDLLAEYATEFDKTGEAVKLSRIRMPAPAGAAGLGNPLNDLEAKGVARAPAITRVEPPAHEYDGTRCLVFFDKTPEAVTYEIWVSPYADGKGAMKLASGWKEPGQLITGLRPEIGFYAFVVYRGKDDKPSKPFKPFRFMLKDMFPMK